MKVYVRKLKQGQIFQSMFEEGACLDNNAAMETFFGLLKQGICDGEE